MPNRSFRGRSRGGISQSQRRKKSWIQITGNAVNNVGGASTNQSPNINIPLLPATPTSDIFSQSFGFFSDPVLDKVPAESTILRIRGSVNLPKNSYESSVEGKLTTVAIGIGVLEATAAALGAMPNPATPEGGAWDGWMWTRLQQAAALDANASVFDVKAMRKVQSGNAIILVFGRYITNANEQVLQPELLVEAQINMRALILLP